MHKSKKVISSLVVIGTLAATPLVFAQASAGMTKPSSQDTTFVSKASAGGMTEIQASKLAESHSQSGSIKSFASTMITDHTKAGDKLSAIAQKDGMTPASAPMAAQQKNIDKLGTLNGAAFDKAYASMMLKDHTSTVALFKKEAASGGNPDLKSFASDTLPTIEQHQSMAKKLGMKSQ